MYTKKVILGILVIVLALSVNITNLVYAKSDIDLADVTIEQHLDGMEKQLLANFDGVKLDNAQTFHESASNVSGKQYRTYYTSTVKGSATVNGVVYDAKSVTSFRTGQQHHDFGITNGVNKQMGSGVRFVINDRFLVFRTQIMDMNLSNYTNNSYAQRIDIVDPSQKKVISVTVKQIGVDDQTQVDVPYEITRQIFTYSGNLKENDFTTLFFAEKQGVSSVTKISVKRPDLENKYGTIVARINPQPNTYDIGLTDASIFVYEAFAQMAQPRWDFHSKDAFFKHRLPDQYEKDKITYQQITDLEKPFTMSNQGNLTSNVQTSVKENISNTNNAFIDIKGHWAESQINEAVSRGISKGITPDKFDPNGELTYEQFMTMLARVLTEKDFIQDRTSGCNMLLVNADKAYETTNGDLNALRDYRKNYAKNNPELQAKIVQSSDYLNNNGFTHQGSCGLQGWHYFKLNEAQRPYGTDYASRADTWAREGLFEVPYVASFVNYYNLTKNNGQTMKDYNALMAQNDIDKYQTQTVFNRYSKKRVSNVYNSLNDRYLSGGSGKVNKPLKREDMALILYSFLDYEQQKLLASNQDYYDFDEANSSKRITKDYTYRSFKSNYSDIPTNFQIGTVINNATNLKYAKTQGYNYTPYGNNLDFFYNYFPEKITATTAKISGQTKSYIIETPVEPIELTSRGVILAVSDAGLLTGSGDKFYPRKTLTRAEGVAVVLRLEKYLKQRYDFINADEIN